MGLADKGVALLLSLSVCCICFEIFWKGSNSVDQKVSVSKPHDYSGLLGNCKSTYAVSILGREMRKGGHFLLLLLVQYTKEQSADQNPTRNLGASSLVKRLF